MISLPLGYFFEFYQNLPQTLKNNDLKAGRRVTPDSSQLQLSTFGCFSFPYANFSRSRLQYKITYLRRKMESSWRYFFPYPWNCSILFASQLLPAQPFLPVNNFNDFINCRVTTSAQADIKYGSYDQGNLNWMHRLINFLSCSCSRSKTWDFKKRVVFFRYKSVLLDMKHFFPCIPSQSPIPKKCCLDAIALVAFLHRLHTVHLT